MAAPQFVPSAVIDKVKAYEANDHVPSSWQPDRPGELDGRQPRGARLGYQGPDQGYGLLLAERQRAAVHAQPGESVDDILQGCLAIALRRASIFGRAPVVHDLTIALTMWGFYDANPPADLVAARGPRFTGMRNPNHHYEASRDHVDAIPEATLRMNPQQVSAAYPASWKALTGA